MRNRLSVVNSNTTIIARSENLQLKSVLPESQEDLKSIYSHKQDREINTLTNDILASAEALADND